MTGKLWLTENFDGRGKVTGRTAGRFYFRAKPWLSADVLGRTIGITGSGWSRIETGMTAITLLQLRSIARGLDRTPSQLLHELEQVEDTVARRGLQIGDAERGEASGVRLEGQSLYRMIEIADADGGTP